MDRDSDADSTVHLPIAGSTVHEVWFWGTVRLKLVRESFDASVDFESGLFTESKGGVPVAFDASKEPRIVHRFIDLWQRRVAQGTVSETGHLRIEFETGATL